MKTMRKFNDEIYQRLAEWDTLKTVLRMATTG
jgi:hypothetical protein